jgi:hypothetical protein
MINIDEPKIEPFQLWLKKRCIWAESHQKNLFLVFLSLVALLVLLFGMTPGVTEDGQAVPGGFTRGVEIGLTYVISALVTGLYATSRNRHLWGWGLIGGLFPAASIVVLLTLPKIRLSRH